MTQPDLVAVLAPDALPAYRLQQHADAAPAPAPAPAPARPRALLPPGWKRADVARLIHDRRFSLAFQPVLRLADRACLFHEAFLRPHPLPGLPSLSAAMAAELAEHSGISRMLDAAVIDTALAQAAGRPVSVNVGFATLADPALPARIGEATAELWLEVRAEGAPPPDLARAVGALRAIGVRVCLDGLDADANRLDWVRSARFDQIKFAGTLTRAATAADRHRRLLAALIQLARAAGAETVAKHIETLPQAWLMQELGVDYGQGWLFGAPGGMGAG